MTIGIIGAMSEEISELLSSIDSPTPVELGSRRYYQGGLEGKNVVLALCRPGKVAAAGTATVLIDHFKAHSIIFTGVAGSVNASVKIGDVVIATSLVQHDMDARGFLDFKRFEIPFLEKIHFECSHLLIEKAFTASQIFLKNHPQFVNASVHQGVIASGDQFIKSKEVGDALAKDIPGLLAVEMEGAAVAQVCYEWGVPFVVIRSISDNADHLTHIDFPKFVNEMAAPLSAGVIKSMIKDI